MILKIFKNALKEEFCMRDMEKLEFGLMIAVWLILWPILCFFINMSSTLSIFDTCFICG